MLNLMYITNNPEIAKIAQDCGVNKIFIDLEINGKEKRQGHLDTVISHHNIGDVKKLKDVITASELLVRVNPIYEGSKKEIDQVIENGADVVMLPFFSCAKEVAQFVSYVNKKAKVCLLCETADAVKNIDEILQVNGIDQIHIGLNDLHLCYNMTFMFELLTNGVVENLCKKFKAKNINYGFGGIASLEAGILPAKYIIAEHHRLGSKAAILSRSFCNADNCASLNEVKKVFQNGIDEIRNYEKNLLKKDNSFFADNYTILCEKVEIITTNKKQP